MARAGDLRAAVLLLLLRAHEPRARLPAEGDAREGTQVAPRRAPREPGVRTGAGTPPANRRIRGLFRVTSEDRITQGLEVVVGKGRLWPSGNEDFLWPVRGREQDSVLNPAIPHPVDGRPHGVFDLPDGFSVDRPVNHVPLELFQLLIAVDLGESPEFQQAAVCDQERAALHG